VRLSGQLGVLGTNGPIEALGHQESQGEGLGVGHVEGRESLGLRGNVGVGTGLEQDPHQPQLGLLQPLGLAL
jgi:hypothetical protein